VLVLGGFKETGVLETSDVVAYDHSKGCWKRLPDMPMGIAHANATVVRVPRV
jgi:hypothetical protein